MSEHKGIITEQLEIIACFNCGSELDVSDYSLFERILCPACETELAVPGRLGHFVLLDELGAGAMGMVYLAVDEHLDREVALKVMREEYGADEKAMEMLQQEAQAAAALNHKNVVQVYEFGQSMHQPYIVMELVNHGRLDLEMANGRIVDEGLLLKVARGVAEGLAAAQAVNLTHGDIKPANILFDKKGTAKVVDFGLARFGGGGKPGEVWGTPYYIAPEKARGKSEDWRSDQYSLGATLWHALGGRPPFDGETPTDVVVARLNNPVPSLQEANPNITKETAAFIERMMNPSPGRRYPTYISALADIDAALAANKAAVEQEKLRQAAAHPSAKKKKNYLAQIMISVVVIVVSLIAILVFQQKQAAKKRTSIPTIDTSSNRQPAARERTDKKPFLKYDERKIEDAVESFISGSSFGAQSGLMKLHDKQPEAAASRSWIKLFNVIMLTMDKQGDSVTDELDEIIKAKVEYDSETVSAENPAVLAQFLRGDITANKLQADTITTEQWFQNFRDLVIAADQLNNGQNDAGKVGLKKFLATSGGPEWTYLLKPLVTKKLQDLGG